MDTVTAGVTATANSIDGSTDLAASHGGVNAEKADSGRQRRLWRPILYGVLSAGGLLAFYVGVITLAQDWQHAFEQLREDRWFVGALALGFGLQIALFTFLRTLHKHTRAGGVVASTGMSTGAMLACCAHHLADVLPVIGLSGAAAFLNDYKTPTAVACPGHEPVRCRLSALSGRQAESASGACRPRPRLDRMPYIGAIAG